VLHEGHITASGNISASGTSHIIGGNVQVNELSCLGDAVFGRHLSHQDDSDTKITLETNQISFTAGNTTHMGFTQTGGTQIFTNITASGEISASNTLTAPGILLDETIQHFGDADTKITFADNNIQIHAGDSDISLNLTQTVFRPGTDNEMSLGETGKVFKELVVNHITASGNISGSAISTGSFGRVEATTIQANSLEGTLKTAAQGNITSLGTLTTLTVDDITINDSKISDSGNFHLDVGGEILLDSATSEVRALGNITASGDISSSATSTGSLARLELFGGAIDLKNAGNQSYVNFYCESSNAHYAQIKAPAHSDFSGNVTTILPSYDFNFKTPNFDANITASGAISASAETTSSFGSIMVGGGFFSSASLAAGGSGGGGSADNLGNHTATQDLNLNDNDILGIQHITASGNISASFTSTGSIGRVEATSLTTSGSGRGILEVDYRLFNTGSAHMASASYGGAQGDVVKFGQTSGLTAGNIVYLKPDGQWANARANALTTSTGSLGVALGSSAQGDGVLLKGMVQLSVDPATGIGSPVFLSDTAAGQGLKTAPDTGGDVVRIVGYYYGNSGLIYFNPDNTFIEVA